MTDTSIPQGQRWTLRPEHEQNPLACLLDYFPAGFQIKYFGQGLVQVVVAEFMPGEDFTAAIGDMGGDVPAACFWAWIAHGQVCLPWAWLMPCEDIEYDYEPYDLAESEVAA